MNGIYRWYTGLSKQVQDSIIISFTVCGIISTVLSILGISLKDLEDSSAIMRVIIVVIALLIIYIISYFMIGIFFKNSIILVIRGTSVSIMCGNIFETPGLRVIGCDTHFDTRINDIVISKNSLHGQLFLTYGDKDEIYMAIESEAKRLSLQKDNNEIYDFPLGSIVRYDSKIDNNTYLMLAMMELNADHEAHTNMAKFELMLMKMWKEIDRVYAGHDVVLPLLGTGISRFDDGPKNKDFLLRCMLCTLNSSGVTLNSNIKILIHEGIKNIPLYEYRDMFYAIQRR